MPYVNVKLLRGVSVAQKKQLVTGITQLLVEQLAKKPEHIHIVIDEIAPQNWGFAGKLTTELQPDHSVRRRRTANGS